MDKILNIKIEGVESGKSNVVKLSDALKETSNSANEANSSLQGVSNSLDSSREAAVAGLSDYAQLKTEFKEIRETLAEMIANGVDPSSSAFLNLAERAGTIKDAISDANSVINRFSSDTKKFDDVIGTMSALTNTIGIATGAMTLFGNENKELAAVMQKVQAIMVIVNGLQQLSNQMQQQGTVLNKLFTVSKTEQTVATTAAAAAQTAENTAVAGGTANLVSATTAVKTITATKGIWATVTGGVTTALRTLWATMLANPITAVIAGITTLISALALFKKSSTEAADTHAANMNRIAASNRAAAASEAYKQEQWELSRKYVLDNVDSINAYYDELEQLEAKELERQGSYNRKLAEATGEVGKVLAEKLSKAGSDVQKWNDAYDEAYAQSEANERNYTSRINEIRRQRADALGNLQNKTLTSTTDYTQQMHNIQVSGARNTANSILEQERRLQEERDKIQKESIKRAEELAVSTQKIYSGFIKDQNKLKKDDIRSQIDDLLANFKGTDTTELVKQVKGAFLQLQNLSKVSFEETDTAIQVAHQKTSADMFQKLVDTAKLTEKEQEDIISLQNEFLEKYVNGLVDISKASTAEEINEAQNRIKLLSEQEQKGVDNIIQNNQYKKTLVKTYLSEQKQVYLEYFKSINDLSETAQEDNTKLYEEYINKKAEALHKNLSLEADDISLQIKGTTEVIKSQQDAFDYYASHNNKKLAKLINNDIKLWAENYLKYIDEITDKLDTVDDLMKPIQERLSGLSEDSDEYQEAAAELKVLVALYEELLNTRTKLIETNNKVSLDTEDNDRQTASISKKWIDDFKSEDVELKIADITDIMADALNSVGDIFGSIADMWAAKLEEAQEKLEDITNTYNEQTKLVEDGQNRLNTLQDTFINASDEQREALKLQMADQIADLRVQKEKERELLREKEKAQKKADELEKKQKKAQLRGQLISAIADTASGIGRTLATYGYPLALPFIALASVTGALQIATISQQMAKLRDGGIVEGPSHEQGGVKGTGRFNNIEVEGGEFVVNRYSTAKHRALLEEINNDGKGKSGPGFNLYRQYRNGGTINNVSIDYNKLADAFGQQVKQIRPIVSVVDITEAQNNLVDIQNR